MAVAFYTDDEVKSLGLPAWDNTMCRIKKCTCGNSVDDVLKKKQ